MKLILLYFCTCLFLFGCNFTTNNKSLSSNTLKHNTIDTTVGVIDMPSELLDSNHSKKTYFMIIGNDTSLFSLVATTNRINEKISCRFMYYPNTKVKQVGLIDSNELVSVNKININTNVYCPNYVQIIREIHTIFNFISKRVNVGEIKTLSFSLSLFSDNIFNNNFIDEGKRRIHNDKYAINKFMKSEIFSELNTVLCSYNLSVESVSMDGFAYTVSKDKKKKINYNGIVIITLVNKMCTH